MVRVGVRVRVGVCIFTIYEFTCLILTNRNDRLAADNAPRSHKNMTVFAGILG